MPFSKCSNWFSIENELISLSTMDKQWSNLSNFFFQSKPSSWSRAKAILIAKLQFKRCPSISRPSPRNALHDQNGQDSFPVGVKENIRFGIRTSEAKRFDSSLRKIAFNTYSIIRIYKHWFKAIVTIQCHETHLFLFQE